MTDTESGKERRHQVERYRVLAPRTTDPLAAGLLRDIILELGADLNELAEDELWPSKKEAGLRILLTYIGLACAAIVLMISYAEKQQEIALDTLSSYKLKPEPVLDDDPDLKQITPRSPYIQDER